VGQVLVESRPRRHAGLLQFNHQPGQTIDEADQIGPAGIERAGHAELADQQEVVVLRVFPIHHAQAFCPLATVFMVGHGHRDALLQQPIDLAVGRLQAHCRTIAGQFVDGGLNRLGRQATIEPRERRAQAIHQHHFTLGLAAEGST